LSINITLQYFKDETPSQTSHCPVSTEELAKQLMLYQLTS